MNVALRPDLPHGPEPASVGGGSKLPSGVQAKMEQSFGTDFSDVRIHEGSHASAIGALGYTQGTDIHFASGQYQPHSQEGQELLGHELTHVMQQKQGRVAATTQSKGVAINDDTSLEREADEMGAKAARGQEAALSASTAPAQKKQHSSSSGTAQLKASVAQLAPNKKRKIKDEHQTSVSRVQQVKGNTCWATAGWCIHRSKGGGSSSAATEAAFVKAYGSDGAKANYKKNKVTDIDEIIGSQSARNRITGSDSAGSFSKSVIAREIRNGNPIVANVNGNHYVIIHGTRRNGTYQLKIMDPATGSSTWVDTDVDENSAQRIRAAGSYALSVLYYTG